MISSTTAKRCFFTRMMIRLLALFFVVKYASAGDAVALNDANIMSVLSRSNVVFVNFYADWCRFSQILAPVFDEVSRKISEEFPEHQGKITCAKVDCDSEVNIASKYRISKYPTLKLFRNGQILKKEYRGQRSVDSMVDFLREELKDPVINHNTVDELDDLDKKKRHVIGYFESKETENYQVFTKVASSLRDNCQFHSAIGPVSASERIAGDSVAFRPPNTHQQDQLFSGLLNNFDQLFAWASENCIPLVREITFQNAEELTEEGLPFLILFHHPDDTASVEAFTQEVQNQMLPEKANVNFLVADGSKFTHPLHHLGKSVNDLPVLAIDSFRHMYLFPHNVKTDLGKPGVLKQFVEDLHSGKLHREFHHGPDPVPTPTPRIPAQGGSDTKDHLPVEQGSPDQPAGRHQPNRQTEIPLSTFRKLAPSRNRYTILRDEL